jgi:hypothetical protein
MGTSVTEDPGMPVRLALNGASRGGTMLAASDDPAPLALYAPAPPTDSETIVASVALPAPTPIDEAPAVVAAAPAPEPEAIAQVSLAPVADAQQAAIVFVSNPVIQPLRSAVAMVAPLAGRAAATRAPAAAAPTRVATGPVRASGWAVQLGAYDSVGVARSSWPQLTRRFGQQIGTRDAVATQATVNGRTVHRLSLTGYANRAEAQAQCAAIVRVGGRCFVRSFATGESVRWASRTSPTRVAAR